MQNVLDPIWVCIWHAVLNGLLITDVNTRCKQHRQYRVSIHPKSEELHSSKSVSELRELSDWRLCVCEIRHPWQACLHERPQSHSALYGAEKYVFLFQFPASITDPTSQY